MNRISSVTSSCGEKIEGHLVGFYVDPNGVVKNTLDLLPEGLFYEFRKNASFTEVWIVADGSDDEGGRVDYEAVLWRSLDDMKNANIDVDYRPSNLCRPR